MRVLFVNINPYLPQLLGGVETSTFQLGRRLEEAGHPTAVLCNLQSGGWVWFKNRLKSRITGMRFPADCYAGAKVYRGYGSASGLVEVLAEFRPDALVVSGGSEGTLDLAVYCAAMGVPTYHYFHDVTSVRSIATRPDVRGLGFFSNSQYTAATVAQLLGVSSTVIPPLVEHHLYATQTSRRYVTMINPRRIKGGSTAYELAAACPDIPFLFVEAWGEDGFVDELRAATRLLPNAVWRRATPDMRSVYSETKLLLVPSEWEETWGRVVTEAHVSGIPALASSVAALPESVGSGGIIVEAGGSSEHWRTALRQIWDDASLYQKLSDAALLYSQRIEASPEALVRKFIGVLKNPDASIGAS